jgi:hypothetical protein
MQVGRCTHTRKRPIPLDLGRSPLGPIPRGQVRERPRHRRCNTDRLSIRSRGSATKGKGLLCVRGCDSRSLTCIHMRARAHFSPCVGTVPHPARSLTSHLGWPTWADPAWADHAWADHAWDDPTWADPTWADPTRATQVSRCSGRSAQFSPRWRTPSSSVARTPQRGPCLRFSRRPLRWQCAPVRSARMVCGARCVIGA